MTKTIVLSGQGVFSRTDTSHTFVVRDASKQLGSGAMGLTLESADLFRALKRKLGKVPLSMAIEVRLYLLDDE